MFNQKIRNSACAFLRKLISPYDYGFKHRGKPIHSNSNEKVIEALNERGWVRSMSNGMMLRHFKGEETYYFTADGRIRTQKTLGMIDVDCHSMGRQDSVEAFLQYLRDNHLPGLFFEASTHGKGGHGYFILSKVEFGDQRVHSLFKMLDVWLKKTLEIWLLEHPEHEIELVEVKGHCPRLTWGIGRNLKDYTSGQLAKLPRTINERFEEFKRTTVLNSRKISQLYQGALSQRPVVKETHKPEKKKPTCGSLAGHPISIEDFGVYAGVAELLLPTPIPTSGRELATGKTSLFFCLSSNIARTT